MNGLFLEKSHECIARSRAVLLESQAALEEAERMCAFLRCLSSAVRPESRMTLDGELHRIKTGQIRTKREAAARARRLAQGFWSTEDRDRALQYAEELEAQADELTRGLAADETP